MNAYIIILLWSIVYSSHGLLDVITNERGKIILHLFMFGYFFYYDINILHPQTFVL